MLYNEETLQNLQELVGGENCFIRQLLQPNGESLRKLLSNVHDSAPTSAQIRWQEKLHSFDNQYFFQGVAEAVSYLRLQEQGWKAIDYVEGSPALLVESSSGQRHYLAVLSFFQRRDEALEQKQAQSLARVLNRIQSDYRIGLVIRKPLVQDFDAEAIRRAVEIWLRQSSGKIGSFAYYKNENVSIEIGISALRTDAQEDVVQFIQGPLLSADFCEELERTSMQVLQTLNETPDRSIILSWVSQKPFPVSYNAMRTFLYGPTCLATEKDQNGRRMYQCTSSLLTGFFQNPMHSNLSGIIHLEQPNTEHLEKFSLHSYPNPWYAGEKTQFPLPSLNIQQMEGSYPLLGWQQAK